MDNQTDTPEVWFERMGPTFGWLGSYIPITMKGFYVLLLHILPVMVLWMLPLSVLAKFELVPEPIVLALIAPLAIGSLVSLMRTAHRHSVPRR